MNITYLWRYNKDKTRWELWYIGRKLERSIFVCDNVNNVYGYYPIIDNPQQPLCGGYYGKSIADGLYYSSWVCITNTLVQVLRNKDEGDETPLNVRVYRPSDIEFKKPIYVGLPI